MSRKGIARSMPGRSPTPKKFCTSSLWRTTHASPNPMMKPPSRVSGNDRKPPSSAAAIAVTVTMSVNVIVERPVSGAMSTPAMPARPAPTPQVSAESLVGDQPMVCTARSFSVAALMASPTRVYRASAHSTAVITHVMPMM